eukprot:CAMPEP_0171346068 /NCGR_PEP_ID=MMETSP0878-20121228/23374_1 /TAXON_ID=67004 /ORGANISM="Thalassiosira weissflogii, Strain CCMP1336" /LENGTH=109 /DNA_ID=CAMNT_0011849645 /DNA_START=370 /DNA_END=700 /DNA_ORIENTATION=-
MNKKRQFQPDRLANETTQLFRFTRREVVLADHFIPRMYKRQKSITLRHFFLKFVKIRFIDACDIDKVIISLKIGEIILDLPPMICNEIEDGSSNVETAAVTNLYEESKR